MNRLHWLFCYIFVLTFTVSLAELPAVASADQFGATFSAGTLGTAVSIYRPVDSLTLVRITYGEFTFSRAASFDNLVIDVVANMRLNERFRTQSAGLYIDRSFGKRFHVSLGAILNQNRISAVSVPTDSSLVINGQTYSEAQAGQIFTDVHWAPVAPYIGIGFQPASERRSRFAIVGEVGAYYEGRAHVTFDSNGAIKANERSFVNYYRTLEGQLSRELSPIEIYPVIQLGVRMKM